MLLIHNISNLLTLVQNDVSRLGEIRDAAMLIDGEVIHWYGREIDIPPIDVDEKIDAKASVVMPGLIDCHSHLIFAGSRADEFAARMNNVSYLTLANKGFGILSTVEATKKASDEELLYLAKKRADAILEMGVTTLEAKSGYGLDVQEEIRALRVLKILDETHALDIHPTFLGAHVVPKEFAGVRARYVDLIINEMLEQVKSENLAIDCDVFCDDGAFTVDESRRILQRAHELSFGLRAHVQQLGHSGGVSLVSMLPIKSISHGEYLSDADIDLIAKTNVVVEALPIAALFLRSKKITPVEKLLAKRVSLAIATDFNPGSAMCNDLVLAARLGVTMFNFSIEEALLAITAHAAQALGRNDIGVIQEGCLADILITNCSNVHEFFYDWTKHPKASVLKRGLPLA